VAHSRSGTRIPESSRVAGAPALHESCQAAPAACLRGVGFSRDGPRNVAARGQHSAKREPCRRGGRRLPDARTSVTEGRAIVWVDQSGFFLLPRPACTLARVVRYQRATAAQACCHSGMLYSRGLPGLALHAKISRLVSRRTKEIRTPNNRSKNTSNAQV
jgi:hypothetical protein